LISRYVDKANGRIKGSSQIEMGKSIKMSELSLYARNNSLKFKKMPGLITELDFDIRKDNESILIKNVVGKYGEGDFKITGNVLFENLYPKISLEYKIERSTIPLFKRSSILLSGNGSLQGSNPPYRLNGKFQLLHGEFLDDPSEYSGDKKISLEEYKKYLPEKNKDEARTFVEYNLNVESAISPLLVKNNMAEIYLKGVGQITGDPLDPEINGRIDALPGVSKFKFKGHDFIISQGYVELKEKGKVRNSDLKFIGVSKINDYEMKIDLSGKIDKLNINLSSEPALTQEDLLSLLTLGVTSDMSKNLEATERKFVTTVGIGTLLVDQLKINEDLNSSLGLKLSVMPEFKEDVTSLVQGKSAVTDSASSRLKSSTKIKVNKQISKQVDVSLSSTVGGSLEQKQEVNVNYNFNKNLSLEGVYEVKPSEDTSTSTSTPNSIGADIKYRWSF
jgi:translocation and assembly module TamB